MLAKVPKDEIDKRVHEAAKALDLEHLLNRKPKALSGGQRQRVALGQAGDHPQGGGLAAAGGTHQDDELLVLDLQVQVGWYPEKNRRGPGRTPPRP